MLQKRDGVVGRPSLEVNQDGLIAAIADLAIHSGSAQDKRRSEAVRACITLDNLLEQLKLMGFSLSRLACIQYFCHETMRQQKANGMLIRCLSSYVEHKMTFIRITWINTFVEQP